MGSARNFTHFPISNETQLQKKTCDALLELGASYIDLRPNAAEQPGIPDCIVLNNLAGKEPISGVYVEFKFEKLKKYNRSLRLPQSDEEYLESICDLFQPSQINWYRRELSKNGNLKNILVCICFTCSENGKLNNFFMLGDAVSILAMINRTGGLGRFEYIETVEELARSIFSRVYKLKKSLT